ncbi:MAG: ribonuclease E/G [Eubacterium sp.]|nr:ribonuclease E/G [Eubacterium sp.]
MKADIVVTNYNNAKMGFLFEDNNLTEAHFFCDTEMVGSICTAVVEKIVPTIGAAFLAGPDGMPIFYQLKENAGRHIILRKQRKTNDEIAAGDVLLVQIESEAQKKKQVAATADISLTGDVVIVNRSGNVGISKKIKNPGRQEELKKLLLEYTDDEFGVIARTAAEGSDDTYIREVTIKLLCELKELIRSAGTVPEHKWVYLAGKTPEEYAAGLVRQGLYEAVTVHTDLPWEDPGAGEAGYTLHSMTEQNGSPLVIFNIPISLEKAMSRKVFLKNGGYLYIEPTEAMTVIDVNSGKNIRGKGHEEGAFVQNLEAAAEIGRLLRLRNISGMIMIDFISMKQSEHERQLLHALREYTKNDPCRVTVVDITKLGIVEVTRQKKSPPLSEQFEQKFT